jgi:predicted N-acetyltransferase YhbS
MHFHPHIRQVDTTAIGIWEARGHVAAVVHPEHTMGEAYFEVDPDDAVPWPDLLDYAEERLSVPERGVRRLRIAVHDADVGFQQLASSRGYVPLDERDPMSALAVAEAQSPAPLPAGFRLRSLADDNDLGKVDRALWRGFNHGDEPPEGGEADRELMQSAPNYRHDLNIVVQAPTGQFVSYCGMWYEPVRSIAMVEPVATDPDYRRMGLGRAAVLEGVRRCAALGATVAYVGSTKSFYQSMGFRRAYGSTFWQREWRGDRSAA